MMSARWPEWLLRTVARLCARVLQRLLPRGGWSLGQRRPASSLLPPGALSPPPPLLQLPADVLHASILNVLDERALCALASCCRGERLLVRVRVRAALTLTHALIPTPTPNHSARVLGRWHRRMGAAL